MMKKKIVIALVILVAFSCVEDYNLDTTAPEITIIGDNPQTITLPATYTELGATALDDTDGDISDNIEITSTVDIDVPGSYEVTYSVSDAAENTTSVIREVIIVGEPDATAPEITIIGENPLTIDQYSEYIEQGAVALDDTDGNITDNIVITGEVDVNVPGSYEVTYTVPDEAGSSASIIREVIVEDTTAPEITIIGDNPLTIKQYSEYTELGATAFDNTDGDISDRIEITSTVALNVAGSYEVTYSVSDAAGNATSIIREVIVEDTTAPEITILGDNPLTITLRAYTELGATAFDDTDGDISDRIEITSTVVLNVPGSYEVTYSVSDAAGNSTSSAREVIVPAPVYLDANGITVKASDGAIVGDVGTINGKTYRIVDLETLKTMIANNEDVTGVCTTKITDMYRLCEDNDTFNQDIGSWDVSNVIDMKYMFVDTAAFNQDISSWNVSNVTDMRGMFGAESGDFNQPIGNWDVSNVTDMGEMFSQYFNQDISRWNVSNVEDMSFMFFNADNFNQNIGSWKVSKVTAMRYMFDSAYAFNQNISSWDVSNVTNMERMFNDAYAFNRDLSSWVVTDVTDCSDFSSGATLWTLAKPSFTNCTP
ncbi:MAG: immunoglobulin-like domain-containing protein [Flavobacteriaceae bacterium]